MTEFGEQAWDVVSRCTGQILRAGMDGRIMGIDFGTCLAVARAAGYDEQAVAELLPALEDGLLRAARPG